MDDRTDRPGPQPYTHPLTCSMDTVSAPGMTLTQHDAAVRAPLEQRIATLEADNARLRAAATKVSEARQRINTTALMMLTLTDGTKAQAAKAWGLTDEDMTNMILLINYSSDLRAALAAPKKEEMDG